MRFAAVAAAALAAALVPNQASAASQCFENCTFRILGADFFAWSSHVPALFAMGHNL